MVELDHMYDNGEILDFKLNYFKKLTSKIIHIKIKKNCI